MQRMWCYMKARLIARAQAPTDHPMHVLTGMMRAVGVNVDGHGEVQGYLSSLFEGDA